MSAEFFTKQGFLTSYAMACGYIHQTKSHDENIIIKFECCNVGLDLYIVKAYDYCKNERLICDNVEGIKQARQAYIAACKNFLGVKPTKRLAKTETELKELGICKYLYA